MASQELIGRYKRYRHGTRNLVYRLTKTAASCGDIRTALKGLQPESTSSKRTLMSPEVGIRAHDLVELARMIAEKGAIVNVEVPGGMLLIVQDVIAGRQKCAAWYAGQALERGSEGRRGGDGHKGFIQILRNVLEILKGLKASASAPCADDEQGTKISGKKKGKRKKDVKLCGMFEDLQLEETGEDSLGDAPAVMIAQAGAAHSTSIKFKL